MPDAKGIVLALKDKGIDIAIASRSHTTDIARDFLDKLQIHTMFVTQEIFASWTHKTDHFQRIHRTTGIPYISMLFFDDAKGIMFFFPEGSPPVNLNKCWLGAVESAGGVTNGYNLFGMGDDALSVLDMTEYSSTCRVTSSQESIRTVQEEMRKSVKEVRAELTQQNQRREDKFEKFIQLQEGLASSEKDLAASHQELAESLSSLVGKKKRTRNI